MPGDKLAQAAARPERPGVPLLEIDGLKTYFRTSSGIVRAVDGISYHLNHGETLSVVGESGCGKSVTALSILRLVPPPQGRIVAGQIRFMGNNLLALPAADMQDIRGNDISMIFQEPMTSLNPVLTVGEQIAESLILHQGMSRKAALTRAAELLALVHIPEPHRRVKEYPHQFSGGMRQRAMIAIALSCNPKVLIADEPTTALDVTIQAQILDLIAEIQETMGTAVILITHDLGVVAQMAQRVVVMYAGKKVEEAPVEVLFDRPGHPYTLGLLASVPKLTDPATGAKRRLEEIPGMVPALNVPQPGCLFAPRCKFATDQCHATAPDLIEGEPGHWVACWEAERILKGQK